MELSTQVLKRKDGSIDLLALGIGLIVLSLAAIVGMMLLVDAAFAEALQAVLLFATLVIVWVYTHASQEQASAILREEQRAILAEWQRNKPVVFVDWDADPDKGVGHGRFVLRNVGGGFAMNVYFVDEAGGMMSLGLGGIAAGEKRVLPGDFIENHSRAFLVVAEGVWTRTRRWNPTANVIGRGRESVIHRLIYPQEAESAAEKRMEFRDYIDHSWEKLQPQLKEAVAHAYAAEWRALDEPGAGS
jgi:hypothetical protein